jgi:uncharacterized protein
VLPEDARPWYPASDPVHGFDHILRVYRLAEHIAQSESADLEIVRAAALLHDAEGSAVAGDPASGDSRRSNHQLSSAEFAAQVLAGQGWPAERIAAVQHCIRAHRFRDLSEQPQTLEAQVLFDADKLDAIGAIGVARAIAYAAQRGQPAFVQPSARFIQAGELEPGEPHSAYHEYEFKLKHIRQRLYTPTGRSLAAERHRRMSDFFRCLAEEIQGAS